MENNTNSKEEIKRFLRVALSTPKLMGLNKLLDMFKYKTEVKVATNPEMGLGLFAKEFIPKGAIVWEFIDGVDVQISEEKFNSLNAAQQEYFNKYAWREDDGYYCASGDLSNFTNHSYAPNLETKDEIIYALVDIQEGEEFFIDYQKFDLDFAEYKDSLI